MKSPDVRFTWFVIFSLKGVGHGAQIGFNRGIGIHVTAWCGKSLNSGNRREHASPELISCKRCKKLGKQDVVRFPK